MNTHFFDLISNQTVNKLEVLAIYSKPIYVSDS